MRKATPKFFSVIFLSIFTFSINAQNCCDIDGNVDLCYLSGADYCGSNSGSCFGYSMDGTFMMNALTAKLSSGDNFGPDGIVDCDLEIKELEDASSVDAIVDCGCDIIFLPNVFIEPGTNIQDLSQSFIPESVLQNIYDWSLECENNLVIATQGEANLWGYTTTNSNQNPNTPVAGTSLNSIFEGPFGSLDFFNQGGSYQGTFTGTPSTGFEVLANDANGNPTAALDLVSNDIVVGDIGIFCSGGAGVVSAGTGVNNNNDILIMNIFALACQLAEEGNKVTVTHEICPGESVILPDGQEVSSAGIYLDTLVAFNGCDSIITTALAYGIEESPVFTEPDTTICEGDTISIDGSLPTSIPIPFFENTTDYPIAPTFFNIVSEIPVTGFGNTLLEAGMITSVCIEVEHNWLDDLDIILIAPNGEFVDLTTDNGLNQDDYIGTCFTETATTVIGAAGTAAPFTGDFLPEGDWSAIYGSEITGTWQLVVKDDANGFTGTLLNWNITFEPILDLTYQWTTPTGLSCDECPITDAFPQETTTYYLTLTDSYGCTTTDSTLIEVIPALPAPNVICDEITLTSINVGWEDISGADGYQINIDNSGWMNPNDGNLGHILSGLSPLDTVEILVQAFDDCDGAITTIICSTPDCDAPIVSVDEINSTSCFGDSDGSVALSATGGSGSGYTFQLGNEINNDGNFPGLAAGDHDIIVTDSDNCDIKVTVEIPQPDSMTLTPIIENEISCFGLDDGSLTVDISEGFAPFSFEWNGNSGDSILTSVTQGDYEIMITDANGCTSINNISISEPPLLTAISDSTLVDCFGNNTGTASISPNGGIFPYSFQWDSNANNQTDETAIDLAAGTYSVTVFDENNCELTQTIIVNEPTELTAEIDFEHPKCFEAEDGIIQITALGGTPNYSYEWSDNTLPNASDVSDLAAANYSVTVSDENGCTAETSAILENPDPVAIDFQSEDVKCFDGSDGNILINVTGAIGNPIYNWDNGNSTPNNDNLEAGFYCVTVSDDNNCEATECFEIEAPTALQLTLDPDKVSCDADNDGSIELTISGGVEPYNFDWSNGSTDEDLTNLIVGNYSVTVSDANDCEISNNAIVDESAPLFTLVFTTDDVDCFGQNSGGVNLSINGTVATTTYQWTGANNFQSTNQDLENVPAGTYEVLVEDEDGCKVSGEVAVEQPSQVLANFEVRDVSCFGLQDGGISIFTEGGTTPYMYSLDGGASFHSSSIIGNLAGGDYNFIVQDANGCETFNNFSIIEPDEIVLTVEPVVRIILGESYLYTPDINIPKNEIDTIIWSPADSLSCPSCLSTIANPEYSTSYDILVISENGCVAEAFTQLIVDRQIAVYVPNIFSPNGDNVNDFLMVFAKEINIQQILTFQIFDRWGEHVFGATNFQPNDPTINWDGTFNGDELNPGIFTWFMEVELADGEVVQLTGDLMLVK